MVGRLPVGMLIGGAKARDPERRCIGERSTDISWRGTGARCRGDRIDDRLRIVIEEALGQRRMIRPTAHTAVDGEEPRQFTRGLLAQSDEIDRLAPCCSFLCTAGCRHLANHARQHVGGMLPADQIETLERLVDEIKRMSAIGVDAIGLGRKKQIGECGRRGAAFNSSQYGTLGRIAMPHGDPAPQPALEGGEVGPACQRRAIAAWGRTVAIRSDATRPVKQSEVRVFFREERQQPTERGQDGQPGIPAIAVAGAE